MGGKVQGGTSMHLLNIVPINENGRSWGERGTSEKEHFAHFPIFCQIVRMEGKVLGGT